MEHSGLDSLDIERIEAGILNALSDFDRTMNPFEAGLEPFVDMTRPDFIGKSALASGNRGPCLLGLQCGSVEPLKGSSVSLDGINIGQVSVGSRSPYLEYGIGYARFDHDRTKCGDAIELTGVDGARHAAELVDLPFDDAEKKIPRGLEMPKF